MHLSLY